VFIVGKATWEEISRKVKTLMSARYKMHLAEIEWGGVDCTGLWTCEELL
jgi:hypothetical protein